MVAHFGGMSHLSSSRWRGSHYVCLYAHRVVKPRAPNSAATSGLRADRRFRLGVSSLESGYDGFPVVATFVFRPFPVGPYERQGIKQGWPGRFTRARPRHYDRGRYCYAHAEINGVVAQSARGDGSAKRRTVASCVRSAGSGRSSLHDQRRRRSTECDNATALRGAQCNPARSSATLRRYGNR